MFSKVRLISSKVCRSFPSPRLAVFSVCVMILEFCLLLGSPSQPLHTPGPIPWLILTWIVWFWLTASWGIYATGKVLSCLGEQNWKKQLIYRFMVGSLGGLFLFVHLCSWGLFNQVGQFANFEAIRFLVMNPPMSIWRDLTQPEQIALSASLLLVGIVLLFGNRLVLFLFQDTENDEIRQQRWRSRKIAWQTVTFLLFIPAWVVASNESQIQRSTWIQLIKTRMHPVTTLSLSTIEQLFQEPILPTLDESNLISLTEQWQPPVQTRQRQPSVIILAVESLRADTIHLKHQNKEVLPNINRLATRGVEFRNAYSQSTHSDYADVCIVSSLYPLRTREHHFYTKGDPWPKTLAFDVFKQAGYTTAIISSQNEGWGNMDQFLATPSLDLFYDAARSGLETLPDRDSEIFDRDPGFAHEVRIGALTAGKLEDGQTMDKAIEWVNQQVRADQPYFLSMNFQSSHFPYEVPEGAEQPFQPAELAPDVKFMIYPEERTPQVKNAYYNGIYHCDYQIGRMVNELERLGTLEETIVIVLGENGEALNENGYCGHAQEPVQPMVHVATVIHAPRYLDPAVEEYPLEHIDVIPTVMGLLEWKPHPNFQGTDVWASDRLPTEERLIYFHVNNASNQADAVILGGRWKLMMDYHWRKIFLYDLATDPGEKDNILKQHPQLARELIDRLETWRANQLSYYHHFNYYSRYYPPAAPRWNVPSLERWSN